MFNDGHKHFNDGKTIKKTMSFNVTDKKIIKKYTKIWEKISNLLDKEFDSDPVYGDNDKYINTKLKQFSLYELIFVLLY